MSKQVRITASSEEEAIMLAKKELTATIEEDIVDELFKVEQVGKKSGFFGFGSKKIYQVSIKGKKLSQREEDILDIATDGLQMDGAFKIKIANDGVFLKVIPPEGDGESVKYQAVKTAFEKKEIVQIDWQVVQDVIHEEEDKWEKIAPRMPELDKDAEINVELSKDKMRAYVSYNPALGGKKLTVSDIIKVLGEHDVKLGIKESKLASMVKSDKQVENILIAEGDQPIEGTDAKLNYHFDNKRDSIGTKREDGSIDYYDLGIIANVNPGDVLVSKDDPIPGKPGKAVTGEVVDPPVPKDKELPGGKNVEKEDEYTLVSTIAGQVVIDGGRINVLPIYEVTGDVDLSTGNIDFVGNVIVKGNVMEGFKIKASGNVEIRGHVSAADIDAGGEVIIKKGFVGKNKYHINARGDVHAKFVENGIIKSDQNVLVTDAIMHSQISAGRKVDVSKNKGLLVGGVVRAGSLIEANIIGSHLATATELEVGIDPELKNKVNELEEDIQKNKVNLDKSLKAIDILQRLKQQSGKLPEGKKLMLLRLESTSNKLQQTIDDKKAELEKLNDKFDSVEEGRIKVNIKIYPGVKMHIGKSKYNVYNVMNRTSFIEDEGDVRQVPL